MDDGSVTVGDDSMAASPDVGVIPLDLVSMKKEILHVCRECQERGLIHSYKWLAEILFAIRSTKINQSDTSLLIAQLPDMDEEAEVYMLAKGYFDLKEYDRSAYFTKDPKSQRNIFLHYYSRYLSGEKKHLDSMTDAIKTSEQTQLVYLKELRTDLQKMYELGTMDGYLLYLYGVVLKNLSLAQESQTILIESLHKEPCHWGAWQELAYHISDRTSLQNLKLPDHWMKHLFLAHTHLELQFNEVALEIYFGLQAGGLQDSTYILAQVAIAFHNMREVDQAVQYFRQLSEIDPYRLDNLDTYSNLLYVKEQRVELAHLAHKTVEIDKYRTETCCVIGNYYSIRSQHEKAVLYFQRALKLNPNYLSAWTLMGHEFMELKNPNAAIDCYREAIKANRRDYRAWYGLGQTYEILKMHYYCLYYYKKAHELRPNDSRMLVALGESYEKLNKLPEALKCYWKAYCVGDIEDNAIYQLARMYESTDEPDQAAEAYLRYIQGTEEKGINDRDQQGKAYRYLANYHLKRGHFDDAYNFAQKCTEYFETKAEGKALLKEITRRKRTSSEHGGHLMSIGKEDELDAEDDRLETTAEDVFSPAMEPSARRDLEPMNLTFTP